MTQTDKLVKDHNLPGKITAELWTNTLAPGLDEVMTPEISRSGVLGYRLSTLTTRLGTTGRPFKVQINVYPLEDGQPIRVEEEEK